MSMHRRTFLGATTAALALPTIFTSAKAATQTSRWPTRPVRLIVAYPPGGATDVQARLVGQRLSEKWEQPVIVDNRPGGNTVIATGAVAKAEPDGHTLLLTAMPFALNPLLLDTLPYDSERDLAPVTVLTTISNVLVAAPDAGFKSVPELIARAKEAPGSVSFASTGMATSTHLSGELFSSMAGVELTHVPYKGSAPAHQDLLSGRVQIMFDNGVLQHIESGRVVPLGVTSAERLPWLPDVPTIAEQGLPGYETSAWYGIFAAGGTPPEVVSQLAEDITAAVRAPELAPRLVAIGANAGGGTPEEFHRFLQQETARWDKLVRERDIRIS